MVSFAQLRDVNLADLSAAARQWTSLTQRLRGLEDEHTLKGVRALAGSGWSGQAATAATAQLGADAKQLAAAVVETHAVATALADAAGDLERLQRQLRRLLDEATGERLRVDASGKVSVPDGLVPADPRQRSDQERDFLTRLERTAVRIQTDLAHTVRLAGEVDERSAWALRVDAGSNAQDFNAAAVAGGDAGDARRAAELMGRRPPTAAELEALGHLLAANVHDASFATDLLGQVGPRGLLQLSGTLLADRNHPIPGLPAASVDSVHASLGNLLALATDQSRAVHLPPGWVNQLMAAGKDRLILPDLSSTFGYEALGPLLRHGQYEPGVIAKIGDDIIGYERAHRLDLGATGLLSSHLSDAPMTALLDGLAHNPRAAEEFFSSSVDPEHRNLSGEERLTYLLRERSWETAPNTLTTGLDSLGHALEAATVSDSGPSNTITAKTVWILSHDSGDKLLSPAEVSVSSELKDSIGKMLGNHIGEVNEALGKEPGTATVGRLDSLSLLPVLNSVARDPAAFGAIVAANNAYLEHEGRHIATDPTLPAAERLDQARDLSYQTGTTRGVLDRIASDEVHQQHRASDKAFNDALESATRAIAGIATLGTEHLPVGGGLVDAGIEAATEQILEQHRQDTTGVAEGETRDIHAQGRRETSAGAEKALLRAAVHNGELAPPTPGESYDQWYDRNEQQLERVLSGRKNDTKTGYDHGKEIYKEGMGLEE